MRVLLVNKYAHVTGGADRHCLDLAGGLQQRGHDVALLSTRPPAGAPGLDGEFVHPRVTNASRDGLGPRERLAAAAGALWNADAAHAMTRLLARFRPDVVHAHKLYPQLSVAPVVVAARAGVPIVQTVHDFEFVSGTWSDPEARRFDRSERRLSYRSLNSALYLVRRRAHVPRVSRWIAVSRFVQSIYRDRGIDPAALPNFADATNPAPMAFEQRRGIVFTGRLAHEKGALDIVALAARLPDVPVTVAGSGPLAGAVAAAAERQGNLTYRGWLESEDIRRLVSRARLVVLPSRSDAAPLALVEALAQGTPVVGYAVGGITECVEDAGQGLVAPPGVEGLAHACRDCYAEPARWGRLSANAIDASRDRYSRERYVERLEAVYAAAQKMKQA